MQVIVVLVQTKQKTKQKMQQKKNKQTLTAPLSTLMPRHCIMAALQDFRSTFKAIEAKRNVHLGHILS